MEDVEPRLTAGDVFGYLLAYTCWLLVAAVGLVALLQTRTTFNVLWPVLGGSKWTLRAIDRFGLLLLGLAWLVYVIFIEQHFRTAITVTRERRHRARTHPDARAIPLAEGRLMRAFQRIGLDVLVKRVVVALLLPLALFMVTYLLQQLGFALLAR